MSVPGGGYTTSWGAGRPTFDQQAHLSLGAIRERLDPRMLTRPPEARLTATEQAQAQQAQHCQYCAGIHAGISTPACPRLASFELDGDGKVKAGTFWPGTDWAHGRVVFAEDAHEDPEEGDGR